MQYGATTGTGDFRVELTRFEHETCSLMETGNLVCSLKLGFKGNGTAAMLAPLTDLGELTFHEFRPGPEGLIYVGRWRGN